MEDLAGRLEPAELNRIGFRLYERFRPEVPDGAEGWGVKAALELEKIRLRIERNRYAVAVQYAIRAAAGN